MLRIPYPQLESALEAALLTFRFTPARAHLCARLFAETTRDGVYTHGLNRFPRFVAMVRNGSVDVAAVPELVFGHAAIERWDGNSGVGNLNAHASMQRAVTLARSHGLGGVALAHTNHWMRAGTYGWQAADQGLFAICWTNTGPNLPAWGTTAATLGNNPLVLAVPRRAPAGQYAGGPHVVLDMAMSQFSYGLALTLDLFAALLSGGNATHGISPDPLRETGLSQFFLAIDPTNLSAAAELDRAATALIDQLHQAPRTDLAQTPRYPGENTLYLREINLKEGVPVEDPAWSELLTLST